MSTKNIIMLNGYEYSKPPKDVEWHYIINQVSYVEELIQKRELAYDCDIEQTIALLARYYRNYKQLTKEESETLVYEHIRQWFLKELEREPLSEYTPIIKSISAACSLRRYNNCHGYKPLRDFDSIYVTQKEIDTIKQLESLQEQELLFGVLCFTKMYDEMNRREGRKVNHLFYPETCVLRRCIGWKRGSDKQLHENMQRLMDCGYVSVIENRDKFEFLTENRQPLYTKKCNIVDDEGEPTLCIDNFDTLHLTWQFMIGNYKIKKCECGRYFQKKCNAQKKCPLCGNTSPKAKPKKPKTRNGKREIRKHLKHE